MSKVSFTENIEIQSEPKFRGYSMNTLNTYRRRPWVPLPYYEWPCSIPLLKIKVKVMYSCEWKSISQLRRVTCHIGSHRQTVTHPSTNPAVHGRQLNSWPVDHKSNTITTTYCIIIIYWCLSVCPSVCFSCWTCGIRWKERSTPSTLRVDTSANWSTLNAGRRNMERRKKTKRNWKWSMGLGSPSCVNLWSLWVIYGPCEWSVVRGTDMWYFGGCNKVHVDVR